MANRNQPSIESGAPAVQSPSAIAPAATEDLTPLREAAFAEPLADLERLVSQTHCAFLLGAGCGKCAGLPLTSELTTNVLGRLTGDETTRTIVEAVRGNFNGSASANIEDYMSELVDHIAIAERRRIRNATNTVVPVGIRNCSLDDLKGALAGLKDRVAECVTTDHVDMTTHRGFVRAVHATLEAGKPPRRVDYFVLNYDTLIEDALSLERIPYVDGFIGGATGWWSPTVFKDVQAHVRVFKVHGSIDWCLWKNEVFPRRVRTGLPNHEQAEPVLIWPAATKYRETQRDPYAQMLDLMRDRLRPVGGAEVVLVICGYSFGDDHFNVEIERALRESAGRLTVIALTSDDQPTTVLRTWLSDPVLQEQLRVYANRGFFHGTDARSSEAPLLWWKFEVLTRLLRGEK
jgi:hypothetical protein